MPQFYFLHTNLDGEGHRWHLTVVGKDCFTLADQDMTLRRADLTTDDEVVGPFMTEELLAAVRKKRA